MRTACFLAGVPGLEPRLTEPESVGLPITPYPKGRERLVWSGYRRGRGLLKAAGHVGSAAPARGRTPSRPAARITSHPNAAIDATSTTAVGQETAVVVNASPNCPVAAADRSETTLSTVCIAIDASKPPVRNASQDAISPKAKRSANSSGDW